QGLKRSVGSLAADGTVLPCWRIENVHTGRWCTALPERVHGPAVESVPCVSLVEPRVGTIHRNCFPHTLRLIGLHTWTADLRRQQSACSERIVTDQFAIQTKAGPTAVQPILGILGEFVGGNLSRLTIGSGHQHLFVEPFDIPSVFTKVDSEPIEQ